MTSTYTAPLTGRTSTKVEPLAELLDKVERATSIAYTRRDTAEMAYDRAATFGGSEQDMAEIDVRDATDIAAALDAAHTLIAELLTEPDTYKDPAKLSLYGKRELLRVYRLAMSSDWPERMQERFAELAGDLGCDVSDAIEWASFEDSKVVRPKSGSGLVDRPMSWD